MDDRVALERFWYGTPAEHRVRRAVVALARDLEVARAAGDDPAQRLRELARHAQSSA